MSDLENTEDELEINWINELSEYIINTIQLYLRYHVMGELKHIRLLLTEQDSPQIILTIGKQEYTVNFNEFKNGTDENNRDDHRECYYRDESVWYEYREFDTSFNLTTAGEGLCHKLKEVFHGVSIDYSIT